MLLRIAQSAHSIQWTQDRIQIEPVSGESNT